MKNNTHTLLKGLAIAACATGLLMAQGARNGTAAASQLLIPQGARYLSGGGAVADAVGLDAAYWNPAGLARSASGVDAIFSRRSYIADVSLNYFGVAAKLGSIGSFGLTARTFDIGEIAVTDVFNTDGTGEIIEPTVFVVGSTYSRLLSDRTSVGVSVNYLSESFARVAASGLTVDAGVQYSSFLGIPNMTIGVAVKNFGRPLRYDGSGLWVAAEVTGSGRQEEWYKVGAAAFDVPFVMDLGATYRLDLAGVSAVLGATFENNQFAQNEVRLLGTVNVGSLASLRGGYLISEKAEIRDNPQTDDIDESTVEFTNPFAGPSFGATLNLAGLTGVNMSVDYAVMPAEFFTANQILAIRFGF